ncbi:pentatricopeptide repeat-containing protein At4g32450, mitochondrial [Rhodamnia argentea]|uniref:Pentatricopeptide repeat-containing protein At4g32450, mitochondrial n=1 Tax=Rhodamnia argentea TaxID=178133 RepID=A0A8B8PHQ3_9MYRT|nr:pentatricopeptide repeat-containing protein At4g32450, mitochondrial [Rhodamnia argentea]
MCTKRATVLAINSLASLPKVRSSLTSSDSIWTLNPSRLISSAAESYDFGAANGFNNEYMPESEQNPNGVREKGRNFADAALGSLNPNGIPGRVDGSIVQSRSFNEHNRPYYGESQANWNRGMYGSYGGEYGNKRVVENTNTGSYGNGSGGWGQKPIESQQNRSLNAGYYQGQYVGQSPQNVNVDNSSGTVQGFERNPNMFYGQRGNASTVGASSYGEGYTQVRPNPSGSYSQNPLNTQMMGQHQENFGFNMGIGGSFQNGQQTVSPQNPGVRQYPQNFSMGQHRVNSDDSNDSMVTPQMPGDSRPGQALDGASEGPSYIGSLEEFDGFCREGKVKEAVEILKLLVSKCVVIDFPRYVQLMHQCGENKALEEARTVHEHVMRSMAPLNVFTYNRILEMYGRCGSMNDAFAVFDKMSERNLSTWDIMITWLAKNGLGEDAIDLFTQFKGAGLKPDGQMFIAVFSACAAVGDIHEGMLHLESMSKEYGIVPSMEHYVSVVDMLGRTGHLDEAMEFVEKMPLEPSVGIWETLMNLCRIHGHTELGDRCAELVEQLDPSRLNEQSRSGQVPVTASDIAKEEEKKKMAKKNLLEARSTVHEYRAGDMSHPETDRIYTQLRGLRGLMKEAGYVPETRFVLHDVDQESKEDALLAHSERLAISYGLLSSPARSSIRVIKNLRVCGDCHNALKIMSKLVGREFIMRDAKRFHHIKDGVCSCRDYW